MNENSPVFDAQAMIPELEHNLLEFLRSRSIEVTAIELIGVKGEGDSSTVFAVNIDGVYHTLKVYRQEEAFQREIRHLRRQIPRDRAVVVWPASSNKYHYFIVIIEVPEGTQLHENMLSPNVSEQLGDCLIEFHSSGTKRTRVAIDEELRLLNEAARDALAHADLFPHELGSERLQKVIEEANHYANHHRDTLRVRQGRTHNDLWWANVIVAQEDVYLIDWENVGWGDYCKDLAFFRLMIYYERTAVPVSMWDDQPDAAVFDDFYRPVLERYATHFHDQTLWQRYAFYAFEQALINFSRAYYGDRRGVIPALNIIPTGIDLFERHCLTQDSTMLQ